MVLDQNYQKGGGRLLRWSLAASEFDYKVVHRKAARHCDADGVSRFPINEEEPYDEGPTDVEPHNVLLCLPGDSMFTEVVHSMRCSQKICLPTQPASMTHLYLLCMWRKALIDCVRKIRRTLFGYPVNFLRMRRFCVEKTCDQELLQHYAGQPYQVCPA